MVRHFYAQRGVSLCGDALLEVYHNLLNAAGSVPLPHPVLPTHAASGSLAAYSWESRSELGAGNTMTATQQQADAIP